MSLPETLCGLLLMPGTLCSVFGPQGRLKVLSSLVGVGHKHHDEVNLE